MSAGVVPAAAAALGAGPSLAVYEGVVRAFPRAEGGAKTPRNEQRRPFLDAAGCWWTGRQVAPRGIEPLFPP